MIFNETIHTQLATLFDVPGYRGYTPTVLEAPNGDTKACPDCLGEGGTRIGWVGHDSDLRSAVSISFARPAIICIACAGSGVVPNVDHGKRYLHVALKHDPPEWALRHWARAHAEACRVAEAIHVPDAFYPRVENGTLRVLEYPAGAGSAEHTDFDLFTVLCWRSTPADLERLDAYEEGGMGTYPERLDTVSPGLHIGEIGQLVGLGPATPHRVTARPYTQRAIVYFAMPAGAARLPPTSTAGPLETVTEWVAERTARSRVYT